MLIKCPECALQVSDKAVSCPHCGYPLKNISPNIPPRKNSNKRRRLPNGFGQISELKGQNLRAPFRAMVTVGKTDDGAPICKLLQPQAYFKTYNEAYEALLEYNKSPYDSSKLVPLKEVYEEWRSDFMRDGSKKNLSNYESAWKYCWTLYDTPIQTIKVKNIKDLYDTAYIVTADGEKKASSNTIVKLKILLGMVFDYAMDCDYITKNVARSAKISKAVVDDARNPDKDHIPFAPGEMSSLWVNESMVPNVDMVIIQCYMGWRPNEMLSIEKENINFDNWTITGGSKTDAGIDRVVPIHPRIRAFIKRRYEQSGDSKYLFPMAKDPSQHVKYDDYRKRFMRIVERLRLNSDHRPHDPRKHFVTMAKKYNVDEYAIKRIVGHRIDDLTERVYTERDVEWLHSEIKKIK